MSTIASEEGGKTMKIIVEAFGKGGAKMVITKNVRMMLNLEETVRRLHEACMTWEDGPSKKSKSPPQSSP